MLPIPARGGGGGSPSGGLSNLLPIRARGDVSQQSAPAPSATQEGSSSTTSESEEDEEEDGEAREGLSLTIPIANTDVEPDVTAKLKAELKAGLLPIAGRGDSTNSAPSALGGLLPIQSRGGLLPTQSREDSTNAAPSGSSGLPISSRGGTGAIPTNSGDARSSSDVHVEFRNRELR
eukprot:CAMPEP_0169389902 /NCGR_PEP_ID=MMETSP1017-20121227/47022_1 /TAXON_ID=342587 /ORGANISM="Karlodinium micrum, Strain CCMP2283" /LENGTH=176 /DNA_ID=CAMNT_0009492185 /DNA_START=1 /DNA_END=529 /DNA_ORIENTATION=-